MRTYEEEEHTEGDPFNEIDNCGIFYIERHDPDYDPDDYMPMPGFENQEYYALQPGEVACVNDSCQDNPIILTAKELRQFANELLKIADEVEKETL